MAEATKFYMTGWSAEGRERRRMNRLFVKNFTKNPVEKDTQTEMHESNTLTLTLQEVTEELTHAIAKHPPMHSAHEGWAVIMEEVDELWEEVKKQQPNRHRMRAECVQVAAMAIRFLRDICDAQ